ncbi:MAG TPA: branched-chain amino acid ABC transporter permease [Firmicutes bacterium]|nr:branched-chain amino acid ABC transporter permease [Bacillota bacterium]
MKNHPLKNDKFRTILGIILAVLAFVVVQVLISTGTLTSYYQDIVFLMCINIIMAVSLNLITGFTGQFSLGHAGFMAIGAYVCALVIMELNTPFAFIIGIFAGAFFAAIVGCLIGFPTLRLKGDYLAIATLGLAEIIRIIIINLDITNGAAGLFVYQRYTTWVWIFGFTVATILVVRNFIRSSYGRACISIREDEIASEAMGINTTKYKIIAFTLSSFLAGIGGALYASSFYMIQPTNFGFMKSIDFLIIVVLGGMGSISGSVIAAMLLGVINSFLQDFAELRMIIYSALLILIMLFRPQGLLGTKELSFRMLTGSYWKGLRSGKSKKARE